LKQHAFSTLITMGSVAFASGLVIAVYAIQAQATAAFTTGPTGFDAVLGARGSQLQLVLNTVFHLETSPGNIPWTLYETVKKDDRVELAVPYAVGDNYQGYRIVGTTEEMFTKFEYQKGKTFRAASGRFFDPSQREAVIGSYVSEKTGLVVGSKFNPYHGINYDPKMRHEEEYVIAGVLAPTNTPSDRVIWIPIEGMYRMKGHVLRGGGEEYTAKADEPIPDSAKEVSAVMLKFKTPQAGFFLDQTINKQGKIATLAWPVGAVMSDLFDKMGWVHKILALVADLVCVVAAGSILASIYNTINERRREFAILRALGARKATVFTTIVTESIAIAALGALCGFVIYFSIMLGGAAIVRAQTGVVIDVLQVHAVLILAPVGITALGALCGFIPAFKAYRTDVAANLVPNS
jgi:putative ABC transport system permease protein